MKQPTTTDYIELIRKYEAARATIKRLNRTIATLMGTINRSAK